MRTSRENANVTKKKEPQPRAPGQLSLANPFSPEPSGQPPFPPNLLQHAARPIGWQLRDPEGDADSDLSGDQLAGGLQRFAAGGDSEHIG